MDSGQVHTLDPQSTVLNCVSQGLTKANSQGYALPTFFQSGASIHPGILPAYLLPAYVLPAYV